MTTPAPLIWTFTLLSTYENCNYKAMRKYLVAKDMRIPYVEGPDQARGNFAHKAFEKRVKHGEPLPPEYTAYEPMIAQLLPYHPDVEMQLGIRANGESCRFFDCGDGDGRGKLDLAIVKGTTGFILDYKTSKKAREDAAELAIGALLLKARYPGLTRITARYLWLGPGTLGREHDVSDTATTWRRVQGMVADIRRKAAANYWPKNDNPLCPWCEVSKHECEFRRPIPG